MNNPTDFTAALSARLPAVLEKSKKPGEYLGPPITSGPSSGGSPASTADRWIRISDPQRGNSGFLVIPKEIHTLNDAILAAGKALSTRPQGSRRIIYVISDGKESRSKANYREVVRYLETQPDRSLWDPGRRFGYLGARLPGQDSRFRCCRFPRTTSCPGTRMTPAVICTRNFRQRDRAELRGTRGTGAHPVHPRLLQSRSCDGR